MPQGIPPKQGGTTKHSPSSRQRDGGVFGMYDSYATIYDLAKQGRYGGFMAQWSLDWLAVRGERPGSVLDLACGTGAATLVFAQAGCTVTGIDASTAMLDIARARVRDARLAATFGEADIRLLADDTNAGLAEPSTFDLVTCFADSLNYLTGAGDLALVFHQVAVALRVGGWLMFDINTEAEYATWDERDVVAHDSADLLLYQKLRYNKRARLGTGRIVWFVREIEHWWRGEETHTQRAWRDHEVRAALAAAGFTLVLAEPAPNAVDGRRFVYVCRKSKE